MEGEYLVLVLVRKGKGEEGRLWRWMRGVWRAWLYVEH